MVQRYWYSCKGFQFAHKPLAGEALASGYKSNAIGSSAQATTNHSVAMGSSALASGDHACKHLALVHRQLTRVLMRLVQMQVRYSYHAMAIGDHA